MQANRARGLHHLMHARVLSAFPEPEVAGKSPCMPRLGLNYRDSFRSSSGAGGGFGEMIRQVSDVVGGSVQKHSDFLRQGS